MKIGAQLYTVRDFTQTLESFGETLGKVADMGYTVVQVSGTCEYEPEWLDEQLKMNGLKCVLTHTDPEKIKSDPEGVALSHRVFDCRYVGIGALPGGVSGINRIDGFAGDFIPAAKKLKENGAYLMYHNHHFEFGHDENGIIFLEKISKVFPADVMGFTLDTYWVQVGGGSPAEWIKKFSGRVPCIHLKDLVMSGTEQRMAPVGEGNINFDPIISAAEVAGTEYLLVEQDFCYDDDPFEVLKKSFRNLATMGLN